MPGSSALSTQKKLAYLGFQYLDHLPYSTGLVPSNNHLFPGLKKNRKVPFFVRRLGDFCRGDLVGRSNFWIFWGGGLQKLKQQAKKCIEILWEYVE
jgi:hypothetical protein